MRLKNFDIEIEYGILCDTINLEFNINYRSGGRQYLFIKKIMQMNKVPFIENHNGKLIPIGKYDENSNSMVLALNRIKIITHDSKTVFMISKTIALKYIRLSGMKFCGTQMRYHAGNM